MRGIVRFETGFHFEPRQLDALGLERLSRYADASGDRNPIHVDPHSARQAGFREPVVHGTLLSAFVVEFIASSAPGASIVNQRLRFLAPILASDRFFIKGRIVKVTNAGGAEQAMLRILINTEDGRLAAMAEVEISRELAAGPSDAARS